MTELNIQDHGLVGLLLLARGFQDSKEDMKHEHGIFKLLSSVRLSFTIANSSEEYPNRTESKLQCKAWKY